MCGEPGSVGLGRYRRGPVGTGAMNGGGSGPGPVWLAVSSSLNAFRACKRFSPSLTIAELKVPHRERDNGTGTGITEPQILNWEPQTGSPRPQTGSYWEIPVTVPPLSAIPSIPSVHPQCSQ